MRCAFLFLTLGVSLACSASDEEHPPEFKPDGSLTAPRKCDEVRKGEIKGSAIWVEGQPAACGAPGMQCPVFDVAAFGSVCAKGTPLALCQYGKWIVSCELDAGIVDAAADSSFDAQSGDASAD